MEKRRRERFLPALGVRKGPVEKTAGQGFALAVAEYAPDGRGRQGVMSDDSDNQWQWHVRSSKARVNPGDADSLQKVKGTLEKFLKQ